jgi:hypothetical protein
MFKKIMPEVDFLKTALIYFAVLLCQRGENEF